MKFLLFSGSCVVCWMTGVLGSQATPLPVASPSAVLAVDPSPTPILQIKKQDKRRNRKKIDRNKPGKHPIPVPTSSPTAIPAPTSTPVPTVHAKIPDGPKPMSPSDGPSAQVSVLSDPVRGKKAIFRVVAKGRAKALVRIYDRTYSKVAELEGEGNNLFDILWTIQKIPEGIYHFQSQVVLATGEVVTPAVQDFTIEKDINPSVEP